MGNRVLLIGQAPGRSGDADTPLEGVIGERLAAWAGMSPEEYLARTDRTNLLRKWPGKQPGGKGDLFPFGEALAAAMRINLTGRRVLLVGRSVAKAFGHHRRPPLAWFKDRGREMAWMYHPSGLNRWYNEAENVAATSRFLRAALNPNWMLREGA